MTYNGDYDREEIAEHLQAKGLDVAMVVRNEEGHTHLHVIASAKETQYWTPTDYAYKETVPDISMQKHEGGKAGLYEYLRSQDSAPLYVSITEEDIDKTMKYRKVNEMTKACTTSMEKALETLSMCSTADEVDAKWASGELPQHKTSKVWREEWCTMKRVQMAKETKNLEEICIRLPVEFHPEDMDKCEWQQFIFKLDECSTLEATDITGVTETRTKKFILSLHGEPGVGKTPSIKMSLEANGIPYYRVPANTQPLQWFDGYMGQPVIWCDDTAMCSPSQFLNLVESDKLPIKGGFVPKDWYRTRWILSNNLSLRQQFYKYTEPAEKVKIEAIMARTVELMMYPNEKLHEEQRPIYNYRGKFMSTREEFSALCRGCTVEEAKVEERKKTEFQMIKERFEMKDPTVSMTIDGYAETIGNFKILYFEKKGKQVVPS